MGSAHASELLPGTLDLLILKELASQREGELALSTLG
jgi:hypothetical protein